MRDEFNPYDYSRDPKHRTCLVCLAELKIGDRAFFWYEVDDAIVEKDIGPIHWRKDDKLPEEIKGKMNRVYVIHRYCWDNSPDPFRNDFKKFHRSFLTTDYVTEDML